MNNSADHIELQMCLEQLGLQPLNPDFWGNISCFRDEIFTNPNLRNPVYVVSHRYIFPVQMVIGVVGNVLNLLILSSRTMRARTNTFLLAMAVFDLLFFISMLPINLDAYESIAQTPLFTQFYISSIVPLFTLAEWFSASSIWMALAVSVERIVECRYPRYAKRHLKRRTIIVAIVVISLACLLLSSFHFLFRFPVAAPVCDKPCGPVTFRIETITLRTFPNRYSVVRAAVMLFALLGVSLPVLFVLVINAILIRFLHEIRSQLVLAAYQPTMIGDSAPTPNSLVRRLHARKVTVMIVVMISLHVSLNLPSALLFIWDSLRGLGRLPAKTLPLSETCNLLAVCGKLTNFFVFYFTSERFRARFYTLVCGYYDSSSATWEPRPSPKSPPQCHNVQLISKPSRKVLIQQLAVLRPGSKAQPGTGANANVDNDELL